MPRSDDPNDENYGPPPMTPEQWAIHDQMIAEMNAPRVEITLTVSAATYDQLAEELDRLQAVYGFTTHVRRL